ncbi:site-specific integrase [Plebeiibacterium sediminum]|uniref:Site-specific integrase n=1 Tax=Plebeiibacterium sediminum TaxID=2992112 RepID=A0AAE3SHJ8_9BACT|nr:site-specific integrase [Plebeiobacterium sediminum]MCW3789347.1 site-specific integrase [Plebeiobacterium sediminum]
MSKRYHRFKLRTDRQLQNGEYAIMMVVTKYGKRQFISLNISSTEEFWDEHQERLVVFKGLRITEKREANEKRIKENALLERYNQRALDIIYEYEKEHIDWTLKQFKDSFLNRIVQGKVKPFLESFIKTMLDTRHIGTAKSYEKTLRVWQQFDKKLHDRLFVEVDLAYVNDFNNWLIKRGCGGNTRFGYLKSVKAIFVRAIRDGAATKTNFPFENNLFNVSELKEETIKRYLPTEYLQKLKDTPSQVPQQEFARQLFLFSYYTYGMSYIDLANLKQSNVVYLEKGTYIVYRRQKTRNTRNSKPISIRITPEIDGTMQAMNQYREPIGDYLLPVVTKEKPTPLEHYNHIGMLQRWYNEYLKKLATELEIDFRLTGYVSRHTMAMQLQENNVPENVISQVMGHKKLETTKVYLDSLKTDVIDKAAEVL